MTMCRFEHSQSVEQLPVTSSFIARTVCAYRHGYSECTLIDAPAETVGGPQERKMRCDICGTVHDA